jgi:hypothetical protein
VMADNENPNWIPCDAKQKMIGKSPQIRSPNIVRGQRRPQVSLLPFGWNTVTLGKTRPQVLGWLPVRNTPWSWTRPSQPSDEGQAASTSATFDLLLKLL